MSISWNSHPPPPSKKKKKMNGIFFQTNLNEGFSNSLVATQKSYKKILRKRITTYTFSQMTTKL